MQHARKKFRVGRTSSHNRCMIANMLKALIYHGRIETTLTKAKELRRHADKMVTIAKSKNNLSGIRVAIAKMMIRYNTLTPKDQREVKSGNVSSYNMDRHIIGKLFGDLGSRFANRNGGYTRIFKTENRVGDNAPKCVIEFLQE